MTGGTDQVLGSIRSGQTAEITTPTGKELEVAYETSQFVIYDSTGFSQAGLAARERLKKILRSKGTEWSLHPRSDQ